MNLTGRTINNRYRIHEKVREDDLGQSYHAEDIAAGDAPRVFTLFSGDGASRRIEDIIRFKSDVKKLVGKSNTCCASVYETGSLLDFCYLVSEPVEGPLLADLIASGKEFSYREVLEFALRVAGGLSFLHECGIILRNPGPRTFVLADTGAMIIMPGAAHIRDFDRTGTAGDIIGVIEHLSPEQCGMTGRPADPRSDLFSLGALLYRISSGAPPFRGSDTCSTLYKVITETPNFSAITRAGAPEAFADVVRKLLEKEPDARYQGAAGLLTDLVALERGNTAFIPGHGDSVLGPRFHTGVVGRERELAAIRSGSDRAFGGEGSLCVISGEAGAGKTRLLEETAGHVFSRGGTVLYSKCNEGYETLPYGAIAELLVAFIKTYRSLSGADRASLRERLSLEFRGLGSILERLAPSLSEIFESPDAPSLPEEKSESARFHGVVSRFFLELARNRPALMIAVDDLQWCDEGSLAVLLETAEEIGSAPAQLVLAARNESPEGRDRLRSFREKASQTGTPCLDVVAGPLDGPDTARLVSKILGVKPRDVEDLAAYVHARAGGNVFFSIGILREMAEGDIIRREGNAWLLDRERADSLDTSDSLIETVQSRIRLLDTDEARILSCAACIGREFSLSLLFRLSSLDGDAVVSVIDRAVDYQLLRPFPGERNTYVFFHDRIKEVLYAGMPPEERKSVHLTIANALEGAGGDAQHDELARHYLLAGADDRFLDHALPAGRNARLKFAYEDAEKILSRAIGLIRSPDDPRRAGAREELARIHVITGNFSGAVAACAEILPRMRDRVARADLLALKSEAHYRLNEWDECVKAAHEGLRLLGEKFPAGRASLTLRSLKEFLVFSANYIFGGGERPGKPARISDQGIIALYRSLFQNYMFRNLGPEFVFTALRATVISQSRIGPSKELSMGLIGVALIFTALAFFKTALKLLGRALRMSLEAGDRWCEAYSYGFMGLISEFMGRYRTGIDRHYALSMKTFIAIGDIKNIGVIHIGMTQSYLFLSDYGAALEHTMKSHEIARKIDDRNFIGMSLVYFARIHREKGDTAEAEQRAREACDYNLRNSLSQNHCAALIELGCVLIEEKDFSGAIELLEAARAAFEQGYFSPQHTTHVYAHLAEACLADLVARGRSLTRGERAKYRTIIRRYCAAAVRHGRRWVSHHGKALRARALFHVHLGNANRAEKDFRRSIERCRALGNRYDLGRSYFDYGLFLAQARRADESRECIESAYAIFSEIGARGCATATGRLLGIISDSNRDPIGSLITRERGTGLRELSRSLAGSAGNAGEIRGVVEKIFEYFGALEGCLFATDPVTREPSFIMSKPEMDPGRIELLRRDAESAINGARADVTGDDTISAGTLEPMSTGSDRITHITLDSGRETLGICTLVEPHFEGFIQKSDMEVIREILSHSLLLLSRSAADTPPLDGMEPPPLTNEAAGKIEKAISYIMDNYRSDISRDGLAAHLGMSPNYFGKLFRDYSGQKMNDFLTDLRTEEAMRLLRETSDRIIDIAYAVGFENLRTFNRAFQKKLSMTPQKYREKSQK
ncbi:MAG: AAA family ATPase [Spirochaetes bacterium]|nr:AAA family ATPase [Spirochaetota bacterium]